MDRMMIDSETITDAAKKLRAGDTVLLSGTIYIARDAAHKKICEKLDRGEPLPFELEHATIYYAGPTPAPEHLPIGSCGPTTSGRMDVFAPRLLDLGLKCMIGKGERSQAVMDQYFAIRRSIFVPLAGQGHWRQNVSDLWR